jgi:CheY-like chemotaxis protein
VPQAEAWLARHVPVGLVADIYIDEVPAWKFISNVRDQFPSLPVILTSAYDESVKALGYGANCFLLKPVSREQLLEKLRSLTAHTGTRRLLIVDDNEVSRYIVREILDQPWLDIREAGRGAEALRLISDDPPDALILDLLMPDVNGLTVLSKLREQPATEKLPVLIYTSKVLTDSEKVQLEFLHAKVVRKQDVSTRLSAQPFLEWLRVAGLAPEHSISEQDA